MRRKNSFNSFLSSIFAVLLLVLIFGAVSVLVNNFLASSNISFVEYNGNILSKNESSLSLPYKDNLNFKVVTFSSNIGKEKDYSVEIIPYGDFNYDVNGTIVSYKKTVSEIPASFYSVVKNNYGFSLKLESFSVVDVLQSFYIEGTEITTADNLNILGKYYALKISIDSEQDSYVIPFNVYSLVDGIELDGDIVL